MATCLGSSQQVNATLGTFLTGSGHTVSFLPGGWNAGVMAGTETAIFDHEVILGIKLCLEKKQDRVSLTPWSCHTGLAHLHVESFMKKKIALYFV